MKRFPGTIRNMMGGVQMRTAASPHYGESTIDAMIKAGRGRVIEGRFIPLIAGGADDKEHTEALIAVSDEVKGQLEKLPELSSEELAAVEGHLVEVLDEAAKVDSDEALQLMSDIAQSIDEVRAETKARADAAAERAVKKEEILKAVKPEEVEKTEEVDDTTPKAEDEKSEETGGEEETDDTKVTETTKTETEETEKVEEPEAVAAAAKPARPALSAIKRHLGADHEVKESREGQAAIIAAGDIPGHSAGSEIKSLRDLGDAFAKKFSSVGGRGVGRAMVASISIEDLYPEERKLGIEAPVNDEKINAVVASINQEAIVAAGGLCAPVAADYTIETISVSDRPIRDALVRFNADRGGIRFNPPPVLSDVTGAVGVWTEANDTNPSSPTTKPCVRITCNDIEEVTVDAVTRCIEVGNFARRTFGEQFAAWWELAGAAHARLAENTLWDALVANSVPKTANQILGTSRDVLTNVDRAAAAMRSQHRMRPDAPLRFMAPAWLKDYIRIDLARQLPGDNTLAVADAEIDRFFAVRNINVTWTLEAGSDQVFGSQGGGGPLLGFPDTVETLLFPEGTHLFLDGGTLDFGMEIRDSSLNATNDSQAFLETFEATAKRGVWSLAITMNVCASGEVSGTTDITPLVCQSGS